MGKIIRTWWLKTLENIDVYTDGKNQYGLEGLPNYSLVQFREGERPWNSMESWQKEISHLLGVECHWVRGRDIYEGLEHD